MAQDFAYRNYSHTQGKVKNGGGGRRPKDQAAPAASTRGETLTSATIQEECASGFPGITGVGIWSPRRAGCGSAGSYTGRWIWVRVHEQLIS